MSATDAVVAVSQFRATGRERFSAIDLNPVMMLPEAQGVVAVDVVIATMAEPSTGDGPVAERAASLTEGVAR